MFPADEVRITVCFYFLMSSKSSTWKKPSGLKEHSQLLFGVSLEKFLGSSFFWKGVGVTNLLYFLIPCSNVSDFSRLPSLFPVFLHSILPIPLPPTPNHETLFQACTRSALPEQGGLLARCPPPPPPAPHEKRASVIV